MGSVRLRFAVAILIVLALGVWTSVRQLAALRKATEITANPPLGRSPFSVEGSRAVEAISQESPGWLRDVTAVSGVDFQHVIGPLGTYFVPEINGAGGALWDYDQDGDLDLFLVNSGRSPKAVGEFPPGTRPENRLYRKDEDGRFVDVTSGSGLDAAGYGIGCAVGDVNNDGWPDLYITNYGTDRLFKNLGNGTFVDCSELAGIRDDDWGTCAAFFDYDRDGWLDLLVVNYTADPVYQHSIACGFTKGRISYCGPHKFRTTVDRLYHNEGVGQADGTTAPTVRFKDVTAQAGLDRAPTAGFGAVCADFTGDRWPDVFIANDMAPNRLWVNQRDGTFRDEAQMRGVATDGRGLYQGSMGVAWGDVDNDEDWDLIVTNLFNEAAILYRNDGNGVFSDATRESRLREPTLWHTGWGVALVDLDHDGRLDLPTVNGFVVPGRSGFPPHGEDVFQLRTENVPDAPAFLREYYDRNVLLRGSPQGGFEDCTAKGGDFINTQGSARALLYGDFDDDGDLDLVVTYVGEAARLYRNDSPKAGHWLMVRAFDSTLRRDAYGAEVRVESGGRAWRGLVQPSSSYLASNDPRVHFGLGDVARYDRLSVVWPDGVEEIFVGGEVDRVVELRRGEGFATGAPDESQGLPRASP